MAKSLLTAFIFLLLAISARAGIVTSNMLTLTTVSNSSATSAPVLIGQVYLPPGTFNFQNQGLWNNTNAMTGFIMVGFNTNPATMTQAFFYQPASTNQTIDSVTYTNAGLINVYAAAVVTPTNAVSVGVTVTRQQ